MNDAAAVSMILVVLCPLLAGVVGLLVSRFVPTGRGPWAWGRISVVGCGMMLGASLLLMLSLVLSDGVADRTLFVYRWMSLPGQLPLEVGIAFRADGLSALLLVVVSLVAFSVVIRTANSANGNTEPDSVSPESGVTDPGSFRHLLTMLLLSATALLLLSADFLLLFMFWQITAFVAALMLGKQPGSTGAGGWFLVQRLGGVSLLCAVLFVWFGFRSLELTHVLGDTGRLQAMAANDPNLIGAICLGLVGAVVIRCAQFPFFGRLDSIARVPNGVCALLQTACVMPVGVYLLLRFGPLFDVAPLARLLLMFLGAFTVLLTSLIAVSADNLKHVLAYVSAGTFGWMLVGLGTGTGLGIAAAVILLLLHSLVMAVLLPAIQTLNRNPHVRSDRWMFLFASLLLTTGVCGQNAVLAAVETVIRELSSTQNETATAAMLPVVSVVPWLCIVGLLLTVFALLRGFFLDRVRSTAAVLGRAKLPLSRTREQGFGSAGASPSQYAEHQFSVEPSIALRPSDETSTEIDGPLSERSLSGRFSSFFLVAVAVALSLDAASASSLVIGLLARFGMPSMTGVDVGIVRFDANILLVLPMIVAVWMMYSKPSAVAGRSTMTPASLEGRSPAARLLQTAGLLSLCRNRFYLNEVFRLFAVVPLRALSHLGRWFDRLVIDGLMAGLSRCVLHWVERSAEPLWNGLIQFYALSIMLSIALMLAVLTWMQG